MKCVVWITTHFQAYHRWIEAPESVAFLKSYHRHLFHVKLGVKVTHGDREVEFFSLKEQLDQYIKRYYEGMNFESSCEMIAEDLLNQFDADFAEVSEDGENGATVTRDPR